MKRFLGDTVWEKNPRPWLALNMIEHPCSVNRGGVGTWYCPLQRQRNEQGRETLGLGGIRVGFFSVIELSQALNGQHAEGPLKVTLHTGGM